MANCILTKSNTNLATDISYNGTTSGLQASNVQDAIDAAVAVIPDGLEIMSYGHSTWDDWLEVYQKGLVVYCRASSQSNPATGSQTRLAFMAYVNDATNPTEVEFQYYRSMSQHSATNQGDEVYVYKLNKTTGWSVTKRNAFTRVITDSSLNAAWTSGNGGELTLSCPVTQDWVNTQITDAISGAISASY